MPENAENTLLTKAIAHANRADELLREGFLEAADLHDSLASTFRALAHEMRVGKSKRKYDGVSESAELPYTMTNELRGADKEAPAPSSVTNIWRTTPATGAPLGAGFGNTTVLEGDPGGQMHPVDVAFDEPVDADHQEPVAPEAPEG